MKKYLCVVLTFIMLISSSHFVLVSASDSTDTLVYSIILSDLGIISAPSETDSKHITRGEFAQAVYNTAHVEAMAPGYAIPYKDVDSSHRFYEGIYNIYAMGAISDSETFRPEDAITSNEAVKIAVSILGYNFLASELGGYPSGYVASANRLGLLKGVTTDDFSREDAYVLLYNMLHCKLPGVNIKDDGNHEYFVKDGENLLFERWNIGHISGYVDEAQFFGTNSDDGVGEGYVGIDGMVFKNGGFDTDSLFGENVEVYYDKNEYIIKSIYANPSDSKNVIKIFSSQDIEYKNRVYSYIDEDSYETKSFTISKNALVIYNGKKAAYDASLMTPAHGSVKYIKNAGDGDALIIKSYTETLAGSVVASDFVVSDKLNPGNSLYFDEESTYFYNQNGQSVKISSIAENDVLWIAESLDGLSTEVLICSDAISGTLTGKANASVYVDGRIYNITSEARQILDNDFRIGDNVRACINPDGEIIWVISDSVSEALPVGYLVSSSMRTKGLSTQFVVKILGLDNVLNIYTFAPKFSLNGVTVTADEAGYNLLPKCPELNNSMAQGIITYSVNKEGAITSINYADDVEGLPEGAMKLGLFKNAEHIDTTDQYVQYQYEWGNIKSKSPTRIFIPMASYRFVVPNPEEVSAADDEDYRAEQLLRSGYMAGQIHKGYTRIEGEINSQYLVSSVPLGSGFTGSISSDNYPYIVTDISQIINSENIEVEKLEVTDTDGSVINYYSEELGFFSSMGLKFGDLVKVEADSKNVATGVAILYRAGDKAFANEVSIGSSEYGEDLEKTVLNSNPSMGALSGSVMIIGNLYAISGRAALLLPLTYDPKLYDPETMSMYSINLYSVGVAMCDLVTETVSPVDSGVLKSFKDFGSACDVMIVEMTQGNGKAIYAYNLD